MKKRVQDSEKMSVKYILGQWKKYLIPQYIQIILHDRVDIFEKMCYINFLIKIRLFMKEGDTIVIF